MIRLSGSVHLFGAELPRLLSDQLRQRCRACAQGTPVLLNNCPKVQAPWHRQWGRARGETGGAAFKQEGEHSPLSMERDEVCADVAET